MHPGSDHLGQLKQALGDRFADHRATAGLTQQQVADRIGYSRVTVATAEGGHRVPAEEFWHRSDQLLRADGELRRIYDQLAAARRERARLHRGEDQARRAARMPTAPAEMPASFGASGPSESAADRTLLAPWEAPRDEVIDYLNQQWHVLVRADNLLGPAHALEPVRQQIALIESLLRHGGSGSPAPLLRLGAQFAESMAWLYEDLGDNVNAAAWTSRALEWAHAADDGALVAWALFRRSQQTAAERDVTRTVALADAASRQYAHLTGPMRAAIAQQQAQGLALVGDERGSLTRLDEALTFASPGDSLGDASQGHGSFCTESYLELQRANCWLLLAKPKRAVPAFQHALRGLPDSYHRDRGHGLARLARALAATGEAEAAATYGEQALRIASGAGSGRTVSELRQVVRLLGTHTAVPAVAALAKAVRPPGSAA